MIELKKNKSLKYYLNEMPIDIINIINNNNNIKFKNHLKLNKKVLHQIKNNVNLHRIYYENNISQYFYIKINKIAINKKYLKKYNNKILIKNRYYLIALNKFFRKLKFY